jgi:uncharacterized protein (TIGR03083 family)
MTAMDTAELLDQLDADGARLADAAASAGWDAPVPGTRWDVRRLVTHTGGIHRWATATVAGGLSQPDPAVSSAVGKGPADDELIEWFREGHAGLVAALRAAPNDLRAFTFLRGALAEGVLGATAGA